MPYKLEGKCVVKEDGEQVKCHETEAEAKAHLAALNANVPEAKKSMDEKCGSYYVPMEAVSFGELESMQKAAEMGRAVQGLTWQFEHLISNILYSDEINNKSAAIKRLTDEYTDRLDSIQGSSEKGFSAEDCKASGSELLVSSNLEKSPIKREHGIDFPAKDYAFVPDPAKPATWKLRLTESPGKVTVAQLTRAAVALSGKTQIPATALSAVKRRVRAEYRKLGVPEEKIPASVKKAFSVWKSTDGQWRWFAVYSNNFRDRDNPPEIISERSHKTFVDLVDKGIVPKPELWHWHIPGSKWGTAEVVGYDNGFAWAAGVVDPGHEKEAENISQMDDIRMSHGMPSRIIKRLADDDTIINFHVTTEISDLPGVAAANELTEFVAFQGVMKMTAAQEEYLKTAGLSEDEITALASGFASKEQAAVNDGIERKETEKAKKPAKPEADMKPEEDEEEEEKKEVPVTAQAIAEAIGAVAKPILAELKAIKDRLGAYEAQLKEVQVFTNEQKELTPSLSLQDLVGQSLFGEPVDGRSALAKSKPKARPKEVTPVGFINNIISEE